MDATTLTGPWAPKEIEQFLEGARIPVRLSLLREDGWPTVVSLWFRAERGRLWCATARDAYVARRLAAEPRCGFEIAADAPPYCGIRGHGDAALYPERGIAWKRELARRYLGERPSEFSKWLLAQTRPETAVCITPRAIRSWDYRKRMGGAA